VTDTPELPRILKGVDLVVGGRGARPHGPERLGQVHPGQHPARQPRVRDHRRAIRFKGDDITDWGPRRAGKAGMFLAFQYPQEIPGVSVINFLRQALSARKGIDLSVLELRLSIMEWMERLDMDPAFADRYLNEGFSGGEKKRNEILQMAILEPELAISTRPTPASTSTRCASWPAASGGPQGPPDLGILASPTTSACSTSSRPTTCTSSSTAASSRAAAPSWPPARAPRATRPGGR
jgi:hypothetical protein